VLLGLSAPPHYWGYKGRLISLFWGEKEWIIAYLWGVGLERCEEAEPFWVGGYGKKENC